MENKLNELKSLENKECREIFGFKFKKYDNDFLEEKWDELTDIPFDESKVW